MSRDINLIGGFYESKSLPFSAQDTVNWLPVPSQVQGSRSPIKLRGLPGYTAFGEDAIIGLSIAGDAPNGFVDDVYSYTYTATGGTPPLVYSISSGTLPPTVTIDSATSEISGTLDSEGLYSFTVKVTDANGFEATVNDTILVEEVYAGIVNFSATRIGGSSTDVTINLPSGTVAGDWLIFHANYTTDTFWTDITYQGCDGFAGNDDWGAGSEPAATNCNFYSRMLRVNADGQTNQAIVLNLSTAAATVNGNQVFHFIRIPYAKLYQPATWQSPSVGFSSNTTSATTADPSDVSGYSMTTGKAIFGVRAGGQNRASATLPFIDNIQAASAGSGADTIFGEFAFKIIDAAASVPIGLVSFPAAITASARIGIANGFITQLQDYRNEVIGATASQSSVALSTTAATIATLRDGLPDTGGFTQASSDEWVQVDLGAATYVNRIYLNDATSGALLQYSDDGISWTTDWTITGLDADFGAARVVNRTARYWRVKNSALSVIGVGEFRFFTD